MTATPPASALEESVATERVGVPAATRSAAKTAAPATARKPSCDRLRWPRSAGARSSALRRSSASRARMMIGRAPQTIVSDISSATFAQYSVSIGAISRAPSRPSATE